MHDDALSRIGQYLDEQNLGSRVVKVIGLTGDASDRRYYRVLLKGGSEDVPRRERGESIVLALHAGPIDFKTMPFVAVARLMSAMPVPVPRILHHSDRLGIIGLDDLGDVTLQAHLGAASPSEHAALYRQAVSFIAQVQQRGRELESPEHPSYRVAFDTDKLSWELEFFFKHFVLSYRGVSPSEAVQRELSKEFSAIVVELASEPRVLCHRDYHSRNLMLKDGQLFIIDFQDARMGPDTYDLVSLLRDSYVDLTAQQVDDLIAYFLAITHGSSGVSPADALEFRRRFDIMAMQRNLKALGTFGYQTVTRGNPVYIQYIPRTLHYVRSNLSKYPRFGRLQELLAPLVTELR
jgi:aminoglycoside/choline kinase family phosphotransferase